MTLLGEVTVMDKRLTPADLPASPDLILLVQTDLTNLDPTTSGGKATGIM